jgi:hypothetical protein
MDFFRISEKEARGGVIEVNPDFVVGRSKDLMVQGGDFYAIWDEEKGLWSRDKYDVPILVDKEIRNHADKLKAEGIQCNPKYLRSFNTNAWKTFNLFLKNVSDNSQPLDTMVTFANTPVDKKDYASRRLSYSLAMGDISAYEELMSTLYTPAERAKIEWSIGAIIAGDAKKIEKFIVFYGPGGTGKSTVMKIIQMLFGGLVNEGGYIATFVAKDLVGNNNSFATSAFKDNPLVAIQHDGDLSKIEDNSKLNSIVSHEDMQINEKYKRTYDSRINAFLFMGTNKPVRISDAKSGLIRRLIDVKPTGNKLDVDRYFHLMDRIKWELGAIAHHCLEVYKTMGKNAYSHYRPEGMMLQTDVFYNYIVEHYDIFKAQDGTSLKQAYNLWKEYVVDAGLEFKMPLHKFREELKNYFEDFRERGAIIDGREVKSYYSGFAAEPFKIPVNEVSNGDERDLAEELTVTESIFDAMYADQPAQYANEDGTPTKKWVNVRTRLGDLDTSRLHYVKVPITHIVIDFDLTDGNGEKSLEKNIEAASLLPPTYAEVSKSGKALHMHYLYEGDPEELATEYQPGIEIKVYKGDSSLRRMLTKCNNLPIATINSGLPYKEKKTMLEPKTIQDEQTLRGRIEKALKKDYERMSSTKQNVDFIKMLLDEAHKNGMVYDVTDLRPRIMVFANNSSNQALTCLKLVKQMKFKSEVTVEEGSPTPPVKGDRRVFFDCEVYPNLFVICWKYEDSDTVVRMINPSAFDVEALFQYPLVGFYNRKYDNHILYGAANGMDNAQLYELSQKLITKGNDFNGFGAAYGLSYADVYDYASKKQTLKKWEIELGLVHMEMDIPWTEPVPPELWTKVVEYCVNDVVALEAVTKHLEQDFVARQILADLSGLSVNHTTRNHATKIIFGDNRNPQKDFVYTDLREEFPGYEFDPFAVEKSTYRGFTVGEGGFVFAKPGIWENVGLLDIASMHPTSIKMLHLFGPYTDKFLRLMDARLAVKNGDRERFKELLPGVAWPETPEQAEALANALKLVINSIYGFTAATFPNEFKDPRNKDNIVAKRGALFMVDLLLYLQDLGIEVVHIKTDSVKIPNITPEIVEIVQEFGRRYGYTFEHEATYKKMCLVNDAVYIARVGWTAKKGDVDYWSATGAQFKHPVVFKALFSNENITFEDLCEAKSVQSPWAMYLDYDDSVATPSTPYKGMHFVGKTGLFMPVYKDAGGAKLVKLKDNEGKPYDVQGTKGHLWLEADIVKNLNLNAVDRMLFEDLTQAVADTGSITDIVDMSYFEDLAQDAMEAIGKYGKFEEFVA